MSDQTPEPTDDNQPREEEPSQGPSGFENQEAAQGGADAVPDTPDGVPEDFT